MSKVQTVLNAVTLPAMPDMKLASSAVRPEAENAGREVVQQHVGNGEVVVEHRLAMRVEHDLAGDRIDFGGNQSSPCAQTL